MDCIKDYLQYIMLSIMGIIATFIIFFVHFIPVFIAIYMETSIEIRTGALIFSGILVVLNVCFMIDSRH